MVRWPKSQMSKRLWDCVGAAVRVVKKGESEEMRWTACEMNKIWSVFQFEQKVYRNESLRICKRQLCSLWICTTIKNELINMCSKWFQSGTSTTKKVRWLFVCRLKWVTSNVFFNMNCKQFKGTKCKIDIHQRVVLLAVNNGHTFMDGWNGQYVKFVKSVIPHRPCKS